MKVFISGICGTGMGPLAIMAKEAGMEVFGSDLSRGAVYDELVKAGIQVKIGEQDGEFLDEVKPEWYVHTSAITEDNVEFQRAKELRIKISKRDELIAELIREMGLKLIAVAGTHGKTTTTAMIIWACYKLGIPISYLVGTTLSFSESGKYTKGSEFMVYEADEYDRNFLHFSPWLAVETVVDYDHPDIYPTRESYRQAFKEFEGQSRKIVHAEDYKGEKFRLAGTVRRVDAALAFLAVREMKPEVDATQLVEILNEFPGAGRRFEKIAEGVYSDYGHHPEEIRATVEMAKEEASLRGLSGVVAVYEPHQNTRQHEVFAEYREAFLGISKLYWLPTFLTRENPKLSVISPDEFIASLENSAVGEVAELGDALAEKLHKWREQGYLILLMSAGPADGWLRKEFNE